jgi:hypothetical protein
VPEEYAEVALKNVMDKFKKQAFSVLVIHQSIKELIPGGSEELSLEYLETLDFDLIVNGHIHETIAKLDGRFLIPGSTVITQLKKDETAPKGYYLYDTKTKKSEFVEVKTRKFFYEEFKFENASELEMKEQIRNKITEIKKDYPNSLIVIKIDGKLKDGLNSSDVKFEEYENVFIENRMDGLAAKIERIKNNREVSVKDAALSDLKRKIDGKITLFNGAELFERLLEGSEETLEYLEKNRIKES